MLSQRFETLFAPPAFALYRALRRVNPSPYLFFLDFGAFAVAASSPEILVKASHGIVTVRPIAGTRRRGATPHEDKALEEELLTDPKERAEHLMLLDLGRNDVGRVAEIGSVKVTDQFFIERYCHVMHIVSAVAGRLTPGPDPLTPRRLASRWAPCRAPEGPRHGDYRRAREGEARLYAGCVGYISTDPDLDTCIGPPHLRHQGRQQCTCRPARVSSPIRSGVEHQECISKAKALFRAAEEARRFASAARRGQ